MNIATFTLAIFWAIRKLSTWLGGAGQEYAMPAREIEHITGTMCQHDFDGDRIFQHRNMDKWKIGGTNQRIAGFALEEDCFSYLEELAKLWTDLPFGVRRWRSEGKSTAERGAALELCQTMYCYCRVGYDERSMAFHPDGSIGEGAASCEVYWNLRESNGHLLLGIYSNHFLTCELHETATQPGSDAGNISKDAH
jgi:hypothetical protein